jgi:mannosyl-3-phosphoglycerate phosphatase family protein
MRGVRKLIFTDIDGTLLDENYSWKKAENTLSRLRTKKIPVIFCSAKTRAEQKVLRKEMNIEDPYIVEDGSAVVVPMECPLYEIINENLNFLKKYQVKIKWDKEILIKLGVDYKEILNFLEYLNKNKKFNLKFYGNMSIDEVAKVTGLSKKMAKLAMQREFSETVVSWNDEALRVIGEKFTALLGGKFVHVYGKRAGKDRSVEILTGLYTALYGEKPVTFGIGNSYTDIPMLRVVDFPAIVKNPDGWIDAKIGLYRAKGIATDGWIEFVEGFVL